jgi:hypothetical protein
MEKLTIDYKTIDRYALQFRPFDVEDFKKTCRAAIPDASNTAAWYIVVSCSIQPDGTLQCYLKGSPGERIAHQPYRPDGTPIIEGDPRYCKSPESITLMSY